MIKVTIYNEGRHDKHDHIKAIYPTGMHGAIKECLEASGDIQATTITLDEVLENGFSDELLNETDVLFWWGHVAHAEVPDELVDRVQKRVLEGMGLVVLHSGHFSKVFKRLMGTGCNLKWRETGDRERIWTTAPHHPIAAGLPDGFMLPKEETYILTFLSPMKQYLSAGSAAAKCSEADAPSTEETVRFSTSDLVMNHSPHSMMKMSRKFL